MLDESVLVVEDWLVDPLADLSALIFAKEGTCIVVAVVEGPPHVGSKRHLVAVVEGELPLQLLAAYLLFESVDSDPIPPIFVRLGYKAVEGMGSKPPRVELESWGLAQLALPVGVAPPPFPTWPFQAESWDR